jgi:hypothetical protein
LFLGGSFAFGHGVEDSEPYPALIQRAWPEYRVANAAVNAWGTTQALLSLEDELARNEQIVLVVYGFITHHHQRNFVRESWLESLMATRKRRNPYFEVDGDRIVFQGLADPVLDGQPDSAELARRELLMTGLLLRDMASLCAERNIPFTVVYLPDGSRDIGISLLNSAVGADAVVDLRPWFDYEDLHFRHDIHLHPQGHRKVAEILRPLLEARLPRSGRSKNYLRNSSDTNHATSALRGSGVQSSNSSTD